MQFPVEDITALIPQKHPFVMVDQLLYADDAVTRSAFTIQADNVLLREGFLQEAGLMENIAQTAALRAGYQAALQNKAVESGYIGSVKNFEVLQLPQTGDELITEVYIQDQVFNVTILAGKIWLNQLMIASCEMTVFTSN